MGKWSAEIGMEGWREKEREGEMGDGEKERWRGREREECTKVEKSAVPDLPTFPFSPPIPKAPRPAAANAGRGVGNCNGPG